MSIRIKICGITNIDDALFACEAGADALGFIFAPEAKQRNRYIDPDHAQCIVEQLPPFITTVGVCVNEPLSRLREYLTFLDRVQLHGEEKPEDYAPIAEHAIKAFRVSPGFKPSDMLEHPASAFLLDAYTPVSRGGTGAICDWETARETVALGRPVILAGGLTPDNVAEAVRTVRPYGVDTAGGVEAAPGKKDYDRIRSFIANARLSLS